LPGPAQLTGRVHCPPSYDPKLGLATCGGEDFTCYAGSATTCFTVNHPSAPQTRPANWASPANPLCYLEMMRMDPPICSRHDTRMAVPCAARIGSARPVFRLGRFSTGPGSSKPFHLRATRAELRRPSPGCQVTSSNLPAGGCRWARRCRPTPFHREGVPWRTLVWSPRPGFRAFSLRCVQARAPCAVLL
jgi:hypothetical protein